MTSSKTTIAHMIYLAIFIFAGAIIVAQIFTPASYSWTQNTVSELAAQNYAHKWIMQAGLLGFGALLAAAVFLRMRLAGQTLSPDLPLLIYAMAIFFTGVFGTAPFDGSRVFSAREAQLHSIFATTAGLAITLSMFWYFWVSKKPRQKALHLTCLLLVALISALFGLADGGTLPLASGLVQRTLHAVGLTWIAVLAYIKSQT